MKGISVGAVDPVIFRMIDSLAFGRKGLFGGLAFAAFGFLE